MNTENWENLYPLNTFTGETKRELVEFVKTQRDKAREEERKRVVKMIDDLICRKVRDTYSPTEAASEYGQGVGKLLTALTEELNRKNEII